MATSIALLMLSNVKGCGASSSACGASGVGGGFLGLPLGFCGAGSGGGGGSFLGLPLFFGVGSALTSGALTSGSSSGCALGA